MDCYFFLGGKDLEMVRIREILEEAGVPFADGGFNWGAKASSYKNLINEVAQKSTPVLVELDVDFQLPAGCLVVDHHGNNSGKPASVLQVLALLDRKPTRWDELVAANDAAWIPGLIAMGAMPDEINAVRAKDREAQGITEIQEKEAWAALQGSVGKIGDILVIRLSHSKTATIGDRLALAAMKEGKSVPPYIVFSGDGEINFSGPGKIASALDKKFPGGWSGGAGLAGETGTAYWGGYPNHQEVESYLREITK
jgi:hypothetical protein